MAGALELAQAQVRRTTDASAILRKVSEEKRRAISDATLAAQGRLKVEAKALAWGADLLDAALEGSA